MLNAILGQEFWDHSIYAKTVCICLFKLELQLTILYIDKVIG